MNQNRIQRAGWLPKGTISRRDREETNNHHSGVVWFTGLSGSGKSTIAHAVEEVLFRRGCRVYILDGDKVRSGLCSDLGFSLSDRTENIRRIGEVAKLFVDAGMIVLTAFISPMQKDRQWVRSLIGKERFVEVFCRCSLDSCEHRDVKGLYRKARAGEIKEFTGISSPYEAPDCPDLLLDTEKDGVDVNVNKVIRLLTDHGMLRL